MINGRRRFEAFESGDFKQYQNRLLIRYLDEKLTVNGKLTDEDLKNAKEHSRMLSQDDLEFISKTWCFLGQSGNNNVNNSQCCLAQVRDGLDLERDAVELANIMQPYIALRLYDQPDGKDKRFQILDNLQNVFTTRSDEEISEDMSTFPGFFQVLGTELNAIDDLISRKNLEPTLEILARQLCPKIVLKFEKYYENSTLGYDHCQVCNSFWVQDPDIKNLKYVPFFQSPEKLESFFVLRFRRRFYAELRDFLPKMYRFFSGDFV